MQYTAKTIPDRLFSAHQGKGTRKPILTRIMVSRSEIDMKRIKDEYKKNYGKTLYMDILVSAAPDNADKPIVDVRIVPFFYGMPFLSFRMTLKETMRRFCLLSVGVKTKNQSTRVKAQTTEDPPILV